MNQNETLQIIIEEIRAMTANGAAPPELAGKTLDAGTPLADLTLDSLGKMSLLAAVEDRADIILGEGDLQELKTLGDMARVVSGLVSSAVAL
jgi:acyl carrier protein